MKRKSLKVRLLSLAILGAVVSGPMSLALAAEAPRRVETALSYQVPDPAAQLVESAAQFRRGDVAGLLQSLLPPRQWEDIRLAYELKRLEPIPEREREEFAEKIAELTDPGAIDALLAEAAPKLAEARAQWPGAQLMAFGAMSMAVSSPESKLTDSQRDSLRSAIPAVQTWITETDFLDEATLRRALELLAAGVQGTGINDLEQIRDLPLEALLDRGRSLLQAGKQAALLYGLDLDALAASLKVEVLEIDGERATVRSTVSLFGAPLWAEHELVLIDGRWYGKQVAEQRHHKLRFDDKDEAAKG